MFDDLEVCTEATYKTAGGKYLEVISETHPRPLWGEGYTDYVWQCPGCKSHTTAAQRRDRDLALAGAQKHAANCTAI